MIVQLVRQIQGGTIRKYGYGYFIYSPSINFISSPGLRRGVSGLYLAPSLLALGAGHELVEAPLAAREYGAAGAGIATVSRALE